MTGLDEERESYVEPRERSRASSNARACCRVGSSSVPAYVAEGKSHLTIAIGCTGGRHRSVTVADRIRRDLAGPRGRDRPASSTATSSSSALSRGRIGREISAPPSHVPRIARSARSRHLHPRPAQELRRRRGRTRHRPRGPSAGEIFAFLGPNGAGKTTTVEILEGYRKRSGARSTVLGEDPAQAGREWRERIGIVLQSAGSTPT